MTMAGGKEPHFVFSDARLQVVSFAGSESVSALYSFQIELVSRERELAFDELVDKQHTLTITTPAGHKRHVTGLVTRCEAVAFSPETTTYRLWLAAPQARMTLRRRLRAWQGASVPDIVREVLDEWGIAQSWDTKGTYGPRDYCVQYRESDWDYCSRLLEEEGIAYYFKHEGGSVTTVFTDHPGYPSIAGDSKVIFNPKLTMEASQDHVSELTFGHQMRMTAAHLRDYNFKNPRMINEGKAGEGRYELYDFPGEHMSTALANDLARVRVEEAGCEARQGYGSSNCVRFTAGNRFTVGGSTRDELHPRKDLNREYLLLSVSHSGTQGHATGGEGGPHQPTTYGNSFRVIPAGVNFRPPRITPRPVVSGLVSARVTGPPGEEICVDDMGRVKVWFVWDLPNTSKATKPAPLAEDDHTSCWIRVSHGWAGLGYGEFFLPRVGQEVLVSFIDGDPDRPIITGRVYNAEQTCPAKLKAEKAHSVIKTSSYPGGKGYNEIRFIDDQGKEAIKIHAQYDHELLVNHDLKTTVKNNKNEKVSGSASTSVGGASSLDASTVSIEGKTKITLKVGGSSIELTPGGITIKGPLINSEADALNTIKGALVKIN